MRPSVHTFKDEYLAAPRADLSQILSEELFGWEKAALGFSADQIRTLVSMATDRSHRIIMGKTTSLHFLDIFIRSFAYLQVTMTYIMD